MINGVVIVAFDSVYSMIFSIIARVNDLGARAMPADMFHAE